jgi:hypothetical protein
LDPAHIFHEDYVEQIIKGLQDGKNVTNLLNFDDRKFRMLFLNLHRAESFDYIVIGSSRSMGISSDAVPGRKLLNIGVSGVKLEDMIALWQICKDNDIHTKNLLLLADPIIFNDNYKDTRWHSIAPFYYEFTGESNSIDKYEVYRNLLSISYTQESYRQMSKDNHSDIQYTDDKINKELTYRLDGSWYHQESVCNRSQKEVEDIVANTTVNHLLHNFENVSVYRVNLFKELVCRVLDDGVGLVFYIPPYHPSSYERIKNTPSLLKSVEYLSQIAKDNNVKLIGSMNPKEIEISNSDFYDAVHPKVEKLNEYIGKSLR